MHDHIINASLQVIPLTNDKHPYAWVDQAIEVIRQSAIKYEVGPFATVLEGKYDEVMNAIHAVNEYLQSNGCEEWICNVQLQLRHNQDITAAEKVSKYNSAV